MKKKAAGTFFIVCICHQFSRRVSDWRMWDVCLVSSIFIETEGCTSSRRTSFLAASQTLHLGRRWRTRRSETGFGELTSRHKVFTVVSAMLVSWLKSEKKKPLPTLTFASCWGRYTSKCQCPTLLLYSSNFSHCSLNLTQP